MNTNKRRMPKSQIGKIRGAVVVTAFFWSLLALPGVCMTPQPSAKEADGMAALHQAALEVLFASDY